MRRIEAGVIAPSSRTIPGREQRISDDNQLSGAPMVALSTVVRRTSPKALRHYFAAKDIPVDVAWDNLEGGDKADLARTLLKAIDGLDSDLHDRIATDLGRVGAMADEPGEKAILGVVGNGDAGDAAGNAFDRATRLLLNRPKLFQRAEEVRYTDDRRRGRDWDGFVGEAGIDVRRNESAIEAFRKAIQAQFGSKNVKVDIFERQRSTFDGEDLQLIQATVYSEGRFEEYLEFVGGMLDLKGRRLVIEASLTYEPQTGTIEAVARDRPAREDYARLFAESLLGIDFRNARVPFRRYDLSSLLRARSFPTDATDAIDSVTVNSLRLMPLGSPAERLTIECARGSGRTIWDLADAQFADRSPLRSGWLVTQARLSVVFRPEKGGTRGKVLPVTITMPHGCDLKDRTDRERLVGEKYLRRWGLVVEL